MFERVKNLFRKKQYYVEGFLNQIQGRWFRSAYKTSFTAVEFLQLCGETYNKNADFQEAIDKIATAIGDFSLVLKDRAGNESDVPTSIQDWLYDPSVDYCTYKQFLRNALIQFFVAGELFYLKLPDKKKLSLVRPNEVTEIKVVDGFPFSYKISQGFFHRTKLSEFSDQANAIFETSYKNKKPTNQVVHFFNTNPILDFRGLSIAVSLINDIEILYQGRSWNRNLLENEGRPCGVFYYPPASHGAVRSTMGGGGQQMSHTKLEEEIKHTFSGHDNAGKALILRGGLQWQQVAFKMRDIDFQSGLKFSRESLANRLGIPLQMFGSENKSTYNNMREARTSFYLDTCVPLANQFLMFLSKSVISEFFPEIGDRYLCVNTMKIQQSSDKYLETMVKVDGIQFLTPNEKREIIGKKPLKLENCDTLLIKGGMQDIEDLGNDPMLDDGDGSFEDDEKKNDKDDK